MDSVLVWVIVLMLVFAISLAAQPLSGEVWSWELGNGLGFLSLAWLYILIAHGRNSHGPTIRHQWLGIAALIVTTGHVVWFLLVDPVTLEYLNLGAPHYMVAGVLSLILLIFVSVTSLISQRKKSYSKYKSFSRWHRWLSLLVVLLALLHVVVSGFYIQSNWQWLSLLALVIICYFFPTIMTWGTTFQRRSLLTISLLALLGFVVLRSQPIGF